MFILNTAGLKVEIPDTIEWQRHFNEVLYPRGCRRYNFAQTNSDVEENNILITRQTGGLGDIICLWPAVFQLCDKHEVFLRLPKTYKFLFSNLNLNWLNYEDTQEDPRITKSEYYFRQTFDCFCPCAEHERITNFKPTKNRIENFAEFLGVKALAPRISVELFDLNFAKTLLKGVIKYKVGVQLRSKNPTKDLNFEVLRVLIDKLKRDNFFVVTFDDDNLELNGDLAITKCSLEKAGAVVSMMDLFIAPDSGLMHLAGNFKLDTISWFSSTNGALTTKYYPKVRVLQGKADERCFAPCYYHDKNNYYCENKNGECLKSITADTLYQEVRFVYESLLVKSR